MMAFDEGHYVEFKRVDKAPPVLNAYSDLPLTRYASEQEAAGASV